MAEAEGSGCRGIGKAQLAEIDILIIETQDRVRIPEIVETAAEYPAGLGR